MKEKLGRKKDVCLYLYLSNEFLDTSLQLVYHRPLLFIFLSGLALIQANKMIFK